MIGDPDEEYGTNKSPPTGRAWERLKGDTDILDTVARGEGGMIWKNSTEMYTLSYVK